MTEPVVLVWMSILLLLLTLMVWVVVQGLRSALRRNEFLTTLLAVGNAHGGKGSDAARAQVATVKELKKRSDKAYDRVAAGIPQNTPRPGLRLKQKTP